MKGLLSSLLVLIGATACGGATGTADGRGSAALAACPSAIDAYCAAHVCPPSPESWCTGTDVAALGTCDDGTSFVSTQVSVDQSDSYFYDASGKLVAIAGWESDGECSGSCRYACIAGPADFDPSRALTTCRSTWDRFAGADGGFPKPPFCTP